MWDAFQRRARPQQLPLRPNVVNPRADLCGVGLTEALIMLTFRLAQRMEGPALAAVG